MQHLPAHSKRIFFFIILLVVFGIAAPVLADYLGPNRTVTTTVSVCKFVLYRCAQQNNGNWDYKSVESWLCSNESKPWEAYSTNSPPCSITNDGHKYYEQRDSTETITITHPPATINGSLQNCTLSNGWCGVTTPELALSANEPLAGYNITLIEGTLNGVSFACPSGASNCTLPMNQGDNTFNYWALSSWGDSSLMGTTTVRVDTVPPEVALSVTGTAGKNGWYKSAVQLSAVASDTTSGVATFEVAVDGGGYQAYTNNTIISFSTDARHTLQFRVVDHAGNLFEPPVQNFYVDTIPPTVNLPASWQLGRNVPYDVIDEGSGLGALRIVIEDEDEKYAKVAWDQAVSGHTYSQDIDWNGQFKDKTVAPPGTYLVWLKASDVAGNEKFYLGKVIVPEPNYVSPSVLPTEAPVVAVEPPAPPAELTQPEDPTSLTSPESAATDASGTTTHTFTLMTGSAGAAAKSSASSSGVVWGAMAVAMASAATAYALDATRKRKEAEEEQAAQVKAEVARSKAERAEKQQKQQENYNKQQTLAQAILAYQQKKKQEAASNAHIDKKIAQLDAKEEANWLAMQTAIKKKNEDKKAQDQQPKLTGYFNAEKQGAPKVLAAPVPGHEPPTGVGTWLDKVKEKVEQAKQWAQDHVVEPAKKTVEKVQDFAAQKVKEVQDFAAQTVKKTQDIAAKIVTTVQNKYEEAKQVVKQKSEDAKQWVQTKYDEAKETVKQKVEETKQWASTKIEQIKKNLNEPYGYLKKSNPPPWLSISGGASLLEQDLFSSDYIGLSSGTGGFWKRFFYEKQTVKYSASTTGTRNPNGFVEVDVTEGKTSLELGKFTIYGKPLTAEIGFEIKNIDPYDPYHYTEDVYALDYGWMSSAWITATNKVSIDPSSTSDFEMITTETVEGKVRKIKGEGPLLAIAVAVALYYAWPVILPILPEIKRLIPEIERLIPAWN